MGGANTLGQHQCAVADCYIVVSQSRLMCAYHWFKVPAELRREVSHLYTTWLKHRGDTMWHEYAAARDQAIEAVEAVRRRTMQQ